MRSRLLACLALALLPISLGAAQQVAADDAAVSAEGRILHPSKGRLILGQPGSTLRVHFKGSRLVMQGNTSSEELYLDLRVDGAPVRFERLAPGATELVIADKLPDTEHHAEIVKRNETGVGKLELQGFETDGQFLAPTPLPTKKFLLIGDSFTCGQATTVRGPDTFDPSKARRQNARLAYPTLLARELQAQVHIVGCAGKGLLADWQGLRTGLFAPEYYELAFPEEGSPKWDPKAYVPDLIGVCLGTNDFDKGIPDQTEYVRTYVEFVRKLRRDAPGARILLLGSPILQDKPGKAPKRSALLGYLNEVVEKLNDDRVEVVALPAFPVVPNDWHPDGLAHEAVAAQLAALLREKS